MVPAGSPAFHVRHEPSGRLLGSCTASLLPSGFWIVQRPCRVSAYFEAAVVDGPADLLTVDMEVASWMPWMRVPMRRVPPSAYVQRDADGYVRGAGLADAVLALAP